MKLPPILFIVLQLVAFSVMLWSNGRFCSPYDLTAASIMLTASTVFLTDSAVNVAVLGSFGYQDAEIRTAEEIAQEVAETVAAKIAQSTALRVAYDATRGEEEADKISGASEGGDYWKRNLILWMLFNWRVDRT